MKLTVLLQLPRRRLVLVRPPEVTTVIFRRREWEQHWYRLNRKETAKPVAMVDADG